MDKKQKIIDIIQGAADSKTLNPDTMIVIEARGQARVEAAGRSIVHNHVNKQVTQTRISPGPQHISQHTARIIQKRIHAFVHAEFEAGLISTKSNGYARYYRRIKDFFGVASYHLIPLAQEDLAHMWLQQQDSILRQKLRRIASATEHDKLCDSIWQAARRQGLSKATVYAMAKAHCGRHVLSLRSLKISELQALLMDLQQGG